MAINPYDLARLKKMIAAGAEHDFYYWPQWRAVRAEVLALDKGECQRCRELKHRYKHAVLVHHVKHLRDRPDLALSIWDGDERQLVSVCKQHAKNCMLEFSYSCNGNGVTSIRDRSW